MATIKKWVYERVTRCVGLGRKPLAEEADGAGREGLAYVEIGTADDSVRTAVSTGPVCDKITAKTGAPVARIVKSDSVTQAKPILKVSLPNGAVLQGPLSPEDVLLALEEGPLAGGGAGEAGPTGCAVVELGTAEDSVKTAVSTGPMCDKITAKTGAKVARIVKSDSVTQAKPILKVSLPGGPVLKGPLSPEDVLRALDIDAPGASGNASGVVLEIGKTPDPVGTAVCLGSVCSKLKEKTGKSVARVVTDKAVPAAKPVLRVSFPDGAVLQGPLSPAAPVEGPVLELGTAGDGAATAVAVAPLCSAIAARVGKRPALIVTTKKVALAKPILRAWCGGKFCEDPAGASQDDVIQALGLAR